MPEFIKNTVSKGNSPESAAISAIHPHLQRSGRFSATDSGTLCCAWSGSQITLRFKGTSIDATIRDLSKGEEGNFLAILLDDAPPATLALNPGLATYQLAKDLAPGEHTLRLFKRTEASVGQIEFEELLVQNGTILPPTAKPGRRIEFIGDSITCGYGNESPNEKAPFKPSTENHYLSYGQLTARDLHAECHVIAWSGEGILRNAAGDVVNPLPKIYDKILPPEQDPAWDFAQWIPHAVVINLGTNDFLTGIPDQDQFLGTYLDLIEKLNKAYHSPHFFCCVGPMITDESPAGEKRLTTARNYLYELKGRAEKAGIQPFYLVEFETLQAGEHGADWHPNLAAHRRMADTLIAVLKKELNW